MGTTCEIRTFGCHHTRHKGGHSHVLGLAEESVHCAVHQLLIYLDVRELFRHVSHRLAEEAIRDGEDVGLVNDRQELSDAGSVRWKNGEKGEETRFSRTFGGKPERHFSDAP